MLTSVTSDLRLVTCERIAQTTRKATMATPITSTAPTIETEDVLMRELDAQLWPDSDAPHPLHMTLWDITARLRDIVQRTLPGTHPNLRDLRRCLAHLELAESCMDDFLEIEA